MNILAIDIGNTNIKYAIFDDKGAMLFNGMIEGHDNLTDISDNIAVFTPSQTIVATTVELSAHEDEIIRKFSPDTTYFDYNTAIPVRNLYHTPETLGADRLAAVIAAYSQTHGDTLVIDIGTAVTYDFINAKGEYLGGNISPGVHLRFMALHEHTSRLPLVSQEGEIPQMGNTTQTAIRCGVLNGISYEIQGYISEFSLKYPNLYVFLTGGDQIYFDEEIKKRTFADKYLVLKGLNEIIRYRNKLQQHKA